ncbi:MAG: hypothetical protein CMM10_03740 [Rhodospirillaceae bacterium]|nr:hypothetical protein [Rhodospirillaceae bacterium]
MGGGRLSMRDQTGHELYQERVQRLADNVQLKETDRAPFIYGTRFWAAAYKGISFKEFMYNVDTAIDATREAVKLLQPDAFSATIYAFGDAMETVDYRPMQWPGHGTGDNVCFQYLDQEFMPAGDYDEFLFDPTGYYIRTYLPRIAGGFEPLKNFPDFPNQTEWNVITGLRAFANPELQEGLKNLFKAGEQVDANMKKMGAFIEEMAGEGFPPAAGGFCKSPYDHFVDAMRGSKGGMLDMFRNKDKLLEAMEKCRKFITRGVKEGAELSGCPYIFLPMHWGLDGFMSPDQFKTFFWPELRKILIELIEDDLIPVVLWEGDCTTRLEIIADIPAAKAVYWFEATDMFRAKEVLGDIVCIRGNVPASLLITGTADDVDDYCRELIQRVGKGGGFMLDGAASIPDEAKTENVVAMAESVRKYAN